MPYFSDLTCALRIPRHLAATQKHYKGDLPVKKTAIFAAATMILAL